MHFFFFFLNYIVTMYAFNPEGYQNTFQTALDGFLYKEITAD